VSLFTTAILPAAISGAQPMIPASHRRLGGGDAGLLVISDAGVAYRSSSTGDSRFRQVTNERPSASAAG
jgi:hypothetical protein